MAHSRINQGVKVKWPDEIDNDFLINVINAFPYDIHSLYELVQIHEITYSEAVSTAAIQLAGIPRILFNKKFIDEWADTWEDIAALIHHELVHRMLLHVREDLNKSWGTTLSEAQVDLLLDIRVQGLSYQMLNDPVYQVFGNKYYKDAEYPVSLLAVGSVQKTYQQRQLHKEIYSPFGVSLEQVAQFIFGESLQNFKDMPKIGQEGAKSGGKQQELGNGGVGTDKADSANNGENGHQEPGKPDPSSDIWNPFLGSHGKDAEEDIHLPPDEAKKYIDEMRNNIEQKVEAAQKEKDKKESIDAMTRKSQNVPDVPDNDEVGDSWGMGQSEFLKDLERVEDYYTADEAMKKKMMAISVESEELKAKKALKALFADMPTPTVRPNFRDKRAVALYSAGVWPVFFENNIEDPKGLCHVYIDDSGSQWHVIAFVVKLFAAMKDYLYPDVHFFSTKVWTTHKSKLKPEMDIITTGGTDMNCVVEHALKSNIQKCLVITDGLGPLSDENAVLAKKAGQKYLIGFTEKSHYGGFDAVEWKHFEIPKEEDND